MIKRFDTKIDSINHSDKEIITIYHEDKVYYTAWYFLSPSAKREINAKLETDGPKVINSAQRYIKSLGKEKGSKLLDFINEDPMMVCSLGLSVGGVTMPIRFIKTTAANQLYNTGVKASSLVEEAIVKYDKTGVRRLTGLGGSAAAQFWGVTAANTFEQTTWRDGDDISVPTNIRKEYSSTNTSLRFFALSQQGAYSSSGCYRGETFVYLRGVLVRQYIPFKKDGHMEFLNLLDFTLAERIGEPTEAYTRNGQPWTPANQTL